MARKEVDREDLLREATALVERIELLVAEFDEPIVAGFRRDGAASFYFGADPVFQFNTDGHWRRGYRDGNLLKAEDGAVVQLRRKRGDGEVLLLRSEWNDRQMAEYREWMHAHLSRLRARLSDKSYTVVGQVPADSDLVGRVEHWLDAMPSAIEIAGTPGVNAD